ncbi:MAG: hypothetical protein IT270_13700 [Saprospiraceae bacterium]|nr:hypothetical protein [Saprospiraceae bacterium]
MLNFIFKDTARFWQVTFWLLVPLYGFMYAPFGINETDGGFLSGLAWQVLNGKTLYADVVYVRPPLSVWFRTFSMVLLPDNFAVLGERWLFYLQVALYVLLAADILAPGKNRWKLAALGFVVGVHHYPPAAWHTTDGILMAVGSVWFWQRRTGSVSAVFSGVFMVAALLCKQSFYPFFVLWLLMVSFDASKRRIAAGWIGVLATASVFLGYLIAEGVLGNYLALTTGAATGGQALQHGIIDFLRVKPWLSIASALLAYPLMRWLLGGKGSLLVQWTHAAWLVLLVGSFAWQLYQTQDYTVPFSQSRLMFWLAVVYGLWITVNIKRLGDWKRTWNDTRFFWVLLGISWCSAVSWGYNLPILFAVPWVHAALRVGEQLYRKITAERLSFAMLVLLLGLFRYGYEFVYRDGQRSNMDRHMGEVFPRLNGIYSDEETWDRYNELKVLAEKWSRFKTLPAFPQAHWITDTRPGFPLDWVVKREMGAMEPWVREQALQTGNIYFIEKSWLDRIALEPELALTREIVENGARLEEGRYFWVFKYE